VGKIQKIKELGCIISIKNIEYKSTQERKLVKLSTRSEKKIIKFYSKPPKIVQKYKQFSKKCKQFLNKSQTLSPFGAKKAFLNVVVVSFAEQQSTNHKI
jgi:hypothetical protein